MVAGLFAGAFVAGAFVAGLFAGAFVAGAFVAGAFVAGALVAGAFVAGALVDIVFVAGLFAAVLLAVPASPQAIPKALKAKSDESAITFFILKVILLSSSKINLSLFLLETAHLSNLVPTQNFWNIGQYRYLFAVSQPNSRQKNSLFKDFCYFFMEKG